MRESDCEDSLVRCEFGEEDRKVFVFAWGDEVDRCEVSACNSRSYSLEVVVEGVFGLNTAIDNEDIGISANTGFLVKAPRRALHPAPCVTKITAVRDPSFPFCS